MFCVAIYLARKQDAKSVRRNDGEGKRQLRCSRFFFFLNKPALPVSFHSAQGENREGERESQRIFYRCEKKSERGLAD